LQEQVQVLLLASSYGLPSHTTPDSATGLLWFVVTFFYTLVCRTSEEKTENLRSLGTIFVATVA
jgi:hypothetical protein